MDSNTPKIRFKISPGTSARMAEQQKSAVSQPQVHHLRGGTAARMAEGEAPVAAQRPYSMNMRARTGKPFSLDDVRVMDNPSQANVQKDVLEHQSCDSTIQTSPFRPVSAHDKFSFSAGDVPVFEESAFASQFEKEAQIPPRSPIQTIRDLFSRTLPKQNKKQS